MPHQVNTALKLSRKPGHRQAMVRNMVKSLFEHERIETTLVKARACQRFAERLISLGRQKSVLTQRRAAAWLQDRRLVQLLFDEIAPRYHAVNGGYTRVIHLAKVRPGDGTPLVLLELTRQRPAEKPKAPVKDAKKLEVKKAEPKKPEAPPPLKLKKEEPAKPAWPEGHKPAAMPKRAKTSERRGWFDSFKRLLGRRRDAR